MTHENTARAILDQKAELVDARNIEEVTADFSKQIDELAKAIQQTKDATALAARVNEKGAFDSFCGGITGKNDKELSESVKILGCSVEITQKIIEVILKISHTKNQFLRSFHSALTNKILTLSKEMDVSYGNQKNATQAAFIIATQLKAQIEDKIKHEEMIDGHEEQISQLQDFAQTKDILDEEQSREIFELKEKAAEKDALDHKQTQHIEALIDKVQEKDKLDNQQSIAIMNLKEMISGLYLVNESQQNEINILKENDVHNNKLSETLSQDIKTLNQKIEMLQSVIDLTTNNFNTYVANCNSLASQLKGLAFPLISLFIASCAIYFSLR